MELFTLESELPALVHDAHHPQGLLALAWALRQRDHRKAMALCEQVRHMLHQPQPEGQLPAFTGRAKDLVIARALLIESEGRTLMGQLQRAEALCAQARGVFASQQDAQGLYDSELLRSLIASDQGQIAVVREALEKAHAQAQTLEDPTRLAFAEALMARLALFQDLHAAEHRWHARIMQLSSIRHPVLSAAVADYMGLREGQRSRHLNAIKLWRPAFESALVSGQLRRAITLATNIGLSYNQLNEPDTALKWLQQSLDLARPTEWPSMICTGLVQTAEVLRKLGQTQQASQLLREALHKATPLQGSRLHGQILEALGAVAVELQHHSDALHCFRMLAQRAEALDAFDFRIQAKIGLGKCLHALGEPHSAWREAEDALRMARTQGATELQIEALLVLARINDDLPGHAQPGEALQHLDEALALALSIPGMHPPAHLHEARAHELARHGAYQAAYEASRLATLAREQGQNQAARQRAQALQLSLEQPTPTSSSEAPPQSGRVSYAGVLDTLKGREPGDLAPAGSPGAMEWVSQKAMREAMAPLDAFDNARCMHWITMNSGTQWPGILHGLHGSIQGLWPQLGISLGWWVLEQGQVRRLDDRLYPLGLDDSQLAKVREQLTQLDESRHTQPAPLAAQERPHHAYWSTLEDLADAVNQSAEEADPLVPDLWVLPIHDRHPPGQPTGWSRQQALHVLVLQWQYRHPGSAVRVGLSEAQRQQLVVHSRERWRACAALADLTLACQLARGRPRH